MSDSIFDTVRAAVDQARVTQRAVDNDVCAMLRLCQGRVRRACDTEQDWRTTEALRALKAELRDFDSRSGTWR